MTTEVKNKKQYTVTIPFAGHLSVTVDAENEDDAIGKAYDEATLDNVQDWEALEQFIRGNVCYCPSPWEVEVECDEEPKP